MLMEFEENLLTFLEGNLNWSYLPKEPTFDYQVPKINELLNPTHAEKLVWEEEMERLARE